MNQAIIFKEEKYGRNNLLGVIFLSLFWLVLTFGIIQNNWLGVTALSISIVLIIIVFRYKFNYIIRSDRIDFHRVITNKFIGKLELSNINQVRFEDEFRTGIREGNKDIILIYPKSNPKNIKVSKSGYIPLLIGAHKEMEIIKILNHFKEFKIDIKVKTKRKVILNETRLRNWNE